jgi:hypothetical protein
MLSAHRSMRDNLCSERDSMRDRCASDVYYFAKVMGFPVWTDTLESMPFWETFMNDPRFGRTGDSPRVSLMQEADTDGYGVLWL